MLIPTLDQLNALGAHELGGALAAIDDEISSIHLDNDGAIRSELTPADQTRFDKLMNLHARTEAHLRIREQYSRSGGQPSLAGHAPGIVCTGIPSHVENWHGMGGTGFLRHIKHPGRSSSPWPPHRCFIESELN